MTSMSFSTGQNHQPRQAVLLTSHGGKAGLPATHCLPVVPGARPASWQRAGARLPSRGGAPHGLLLYFNYIFLKFVIVRCAVVKFVIVRCIIFIVKCILVTVISGL
jgi:hypothetical protein